MATIADVIWYRRANLLVRAAVGQLVVGVCGACVIDEVLLPYYAAHDMSADASRAVLARWVLWAATGLRLAWLYLVAAAGPWSGPGRRYGLCPKHTMAAAGGGERWRILDLVLLSGISAGTIAFTAVALPYARGFARRSIGDEEEQQQQHQQQNRYMVLLLPPSVFPVGAAVIILLMTVYTMLGLWDLQMLREYIRSKRQVDITPTMNPSPAIIAPQNGGSTRSNSSDDEDDTSAVAREDSRRRRRRRKEVRRLGVTRQRRWSR